MKLSEKIQEALREQQEINLSDPEVQKRLAAQWGYVPADAQPAPSEEARLVSYCPDGNTCTLNIKGVEMYYDRVDMDATPAPDARPDDVVEQAVNRFLSWKLPKDFHPDGGMVFIPTKGRGHDSPHWPIGTNLLNAQQAREMLRYVLAAPEAKP